MGDVVSDMLARTLDVFRRDDPNLIKEVERSDDTVDSLHEAIKIYLTRLARNELDPTESRRTVETLSFTTNLERSEEHTSELQSLMRISYAVFCLKKKNTKNHK